VENLASYILKNQTNKYCIWAWI